MKKSYNINTRTFTLLSFTISLLSIGIISIMIYLGFSSQAIAKKQAPQIRVIGLVKTEVITAHLWLEEILSGDRSENIENVYNHFEKADSYIKTILNGGLIDEKQVIAITNTNIIKEIAEVQITINQLLELTKSRLLNLENSQAGTDIDVTFDAVFEQFTQKITIAEKSLIQLQQKKLSTFITSQKILIGISIILGALIITFLFYFEKFKAIKEQKVVSLNKKIIENEKRFRLLYQNAPLPYQSLDIDGFLIDVNPAWVKSLGYSREETLGKHFTEFMTKESAELVKTRFPNFLASGSIYNAEFEMIRKDNSKLLVSYNGKISKNEDNKFGQTHCVFSDISEQKKIEEELIVEKEFSEKIIETSAAFIIGLDKNRLIQIFNEGAEKITGYKKNEVIGKDWFEIFFPKEQVPEMNTVWKNAWGSEVHSYQNYILPKTGQEKLISWQTTGVYSEKDNSRHLLISIGEDITERNLKQEALNAANKIINRSPVIAFRWKNKDNWPVEFVTNNVENLTEINSQDFKNNAISYNSIIHKNDRERVAKEVTEASENNHLTSFKHKPYRIITKSNKIKWVLDHTFILRNSDGIITHYEGIIYDITKEKLASEKIELFSRIFEESLNEIYLFDAKTLLFTQVNAAAQKNIGYTAEELAKMTPLHFKPLLNKEAFNELIAPLQKGEKEKIIFETVHQRKDKSTYDAEVHLQIIEYEEKSLFVAIISDITERKKQEKSIIESEARFRSIFMNNHTVMFIINPENNRFIDVNPAAVDYYGYTYEEFINELKINEINTLSLKEIKERMKEAKTKKHAYFIFKHRLKSGEIRDVEVHTGLLNYNNKKRLFTIIIDITEKLQAEIALEKSLKKIESIFRAAPTGIGAVSNRVFTEVNEQFCKITGYSTEELLGKEAKIIYSSLKEFDRVGKEKYEQIRKTGTGTVETQFKRKNGEIIDILMSSTPINMNDLSLGVTFTTLEITKRKKALAELQKHKNHLEELVKERTVELEQSEESLLNIVDDLNIKTIQVEKSNKKLASINAEMETFTYSVSHDLKAPLRGIDGYSKLLLDLYKKDLNDEAQEFLMNVRSGTKQMNTLINDLLAYSRLERQNFQFKKILLKPLITDLLLLSSNEIDKNKVQITTNISEDFSLIADSEGLKLVLRNLLDNAIKFSSQQNNPHIEVVTSENSTHWCIFVKDNGVGFDMKYHDRIFKIFQRLHLPEEFEGTGIGLAMVEKAVHRMNGTIWAESKPNEGAGFYIEIKK